jgi:hypothetical protein
MSLDYFFGSLKRVRDKKKGKELEPNLTKEATPNAQEKNFEKIVAPR